MESSPTVREKLCAAWEAVLSRLINEDFPQDECVETMIEIGLSRLCAQRGVAGAAAYLGTLRASVNDAQSRKLAELGRASFGPADDAPFAWSTSGASNGRFGAWLRPAYPQLPDSFGRKE